MNKISLLSLLVIAWLQISEPNRQVILTCGPDQGSERGSPGAPGKRGPVGYPGLKGDQGIKGSQGIPGECSICHQLNQSFISQHENFNQNLINQEEKYNQNLITQEEKFNKSLINQQENFNQNLITQEEKFNRSLSKLQQDFNRHLSTIQETFNQTLSNLQETVKGNQQTILSTLAKNCRDLANGGARRNGIYNISVPGRLVQVYCDLQSSGGNWLVFQRRVNGSVDFYRNWTEYQRGFGDLNGEFWLGLDLLHTITNSQSYELRVEVEDWEGNTAHASYRNFSIGNEGSNYVLNVHGYSGTAGDSLAWHNNRQFTTNDRDNDEWDRNCAVQWHGAWWYRACHESNLNGEYLRNGEINPRGVTWSRWENNHYSMKKAKMMMRPT